MNDQELMRGSIDELRAEIDLLNRTLLDVRYEDFKRVALAQIQFIISRYYDETVRKGMERMDTMPECGLRCECKAKLKGLLEGIGHDFMMDDFESSMVKLEDDLKMLRGEGSLCESNECRDNAIRMLEEVGMLVRMTGAIHEGIVGCEGEDMDIQTEHVPSPEESSRLISPLSHPLRVKILRELETGERGFSDLSRRLKMRTGHLQYHLRTLLGEGYVSKFRNRGDYSITQRGKAALDLLEMFTRKMGT
jgi:DNA-binding HxlR family transcriptional regulator